MAEVSKKADQNNPRAMIAALAKSLGLDVDPDQYAASVVRTGDKIIIPDGASIPEVIESLQREYDSERQKVSVNATIAVAPWDGAIALHEAITQELGLAIAREIPGGWFSPERPPEEIEVEYELNLTPPTSPPDPKCYMCNGRGYLYIAPGRHLAVYCENCRYR